MDFDGQKAAEQLCLYIILISGILAFGVGWFDASFALMMKVQICLASLACRYDCCIRAGIYRGATILHVNTAFSYEPATWHISLQRHSLDPIWTRKFNDNPST